MRPFAYARAGAPEDAFAAFAATPGAAYLAGGTNLIDLIKIDVASPPLVIDINALPLGAIESASDGTVRIGAMARMSQTADHPAVAQGAPVLAQALNASASAQLRNMASIGGNLMQRTRCAYFRDVATPCNKRQPGAGCSAIHGVNRIHAILGASDQCIATHPSDMCVALAALEAIVHVTGPDGERTIPLSAFHRLPATNPEQDTNLGPAEIITSVELPPAGFATHYTYLKLRDRLSYAFALVSVAAALEIDGDAIRTARLALGGVAHKPWRDTAAEGLLAGHPPVTATFSRAADHVLGAAKGYGHNDFKIPLARKAIVRALEQAAAGTPQSLTEKRIV